jgi:pullulanase
MPDQMRAVKRNIISLPGIAAFDDDLRDALIGAHGNRKSRGFVSGQGLREEPVKFGIIGAVSHPQIVYDYIESSKMAWAGDPGQCINYVSCHDNYTLFDKLKLSCPKATDPDLRKMAKLAGSVILTSQGVPFLHSGSEFCRTKGGNGNSYKSPDSVNQIDWLRKKEYKDVFEYYRKLIDLRKKHPAFRMRETNQIREHIKFSAEYKTGIISYYIDGESVSDSWKFIIMIFNGNREKISIPLPEGTFRIMANSNDIREDGIGDYLSGEVEAEGISMTVLVRTTAL